MKLTQKQRERLPEIQRLMRAIDLETDIPPRSIGSINCVKASGAQVPNTTIKLLLLTQRGDIDFDDYVKFSFYFSASRASQEGQFT